MNIRATRHGHCPLMPHLRREAPCYIPGPGSGGQMRNTRLAGAAYARLAARSWPAIRGTAVPIGSRMTAVAAMS